MARNKLIQFMRGNEADLPTLNAGEPGFALDTEKLYIGNGTGNTLINKDVTIESGFVNSTDSVLSFTNATRTFQIAPVTTSFTFYVNDEAHAKTSAETVVIDNTTGLHFIYYNTSGVLSKTTTWDTELLIGQSALVAVVGWDPDHSIATIVADERHGRMDWQTHAYLHEVFHAQWVSGFALGDLVVGGDGDSDSHAQLSVGNGVFRDEDLRHVIADGSPQTLTFPAEIPVFYRNGTDGRWHKTTATTFPASKGTNRLYWNENTSGTVWQRTEVASNNDYVLYHLFVTADIYNPVISIMGQAEYTTTAAAEAAASTELNNILFGDLTALVPEMLPIATLIFQTSTLKSNTVAASIESTAEGEDYIDWRFASQATGGGSTTGTVWGGITGTLSDQLDLASALNAKQDTITVGIADDNIVSIDSASVVDNDYAKFTANGLEGRSYSEVLSDIGAEPAFSKNTAFNKNFGTAVSTVCQGNDSRLSDARTPTSHDNTHHSATYITSTGVTYENLSANGDVGTGATQVAQGSHTHSTYLLIANIDDVPVNGVVNAPISSNWAYDHANSATAHGTYDNYGSWTIRDGDTTTYTITSGGTLQIAAGTGITSNFTADDVLTISCTVTGGDTNQNAFSNVAVSGQTTIAADSTTDTLTIAAGTGITLTTNATTDTLTITNTVSAGISEVKDDTTPQLGGDLDVNGRGIIGDIIYFGSSTGETYIECVLGGEIILRYDDLPKLETTTTGVDVVGTLDASTGITINGVSVVNQNAFSNVAVSGQTTISADTTTDTLTVAAGTGISLTTNATTDTLTISSAVSSSFSRTQLFDGSSTPAGEGDTVDWSSTGYTYDDFDYLEVVYRCIGLPPVISGTFTYLINPLWISSTYYKHQCPGVHNDGASNYVRPSLDFDYTSKTDLYVNGGANVGDDVEILEINGILL